MNKLDLALRLARESHRSRAKAADDVDTLVYNLLRDLKRSAKAVLSQEKPLAVTHVAAPKDKS